MNALTEEMYSKLTHIAIDLHFDDLIRVVVIAGSGGAFCSGVDVSETQDEVPALTRVRRHGELARLIQQLPMPTIAAVDGPAVGAGCNLALGCDLVVASDRASFAELFVKRGMGLDWGGSWLLPRLVGLRKAKEIAFFGNRITAGEALELDLINRVVSTAELADTVNEWATKLAQSAPLALSLIKAELNASVGPALSSMLQIETYGQVSARGTRDAAEGFASFIEKRPPRFEGN